MDSSNAPISADARPPAQGFLPSLSPDAAPAAGRARLGAGLRLAGSALALAAAGGLLANFGEPLAAGEPLPWLLLAALLACASLLLADLRGAGREQQADRRWQALLASSGLGVSEWTRAREGASGRVSNSPLWSRMTGLEARSRSTQPTDWLDSAAVHPQDRDRVIAAVQALLWPDSGDHCHERLRLRGERGDWRWHALHVQVSQRNAQGQAQALLHTLADAGAEATADERQRISIALFQNLHDGLLVTDPEGRVLDANPAFCRMVGLPREALMNKPAAVLQPLALQRSGHDAAQLAQTLAAEETWTGRVQIEHGSSGAECTLDLSISAIPEPEGPPRMQVVTAQDLSPTLRQQALLSRLTRYDPLTGLPNSEEFSRLLQLATASSERESLRLSICRVDLDHFRRINAEQGRAAGDELLRQVASRLQGALRSGPNWSDCVARLGGDEFALLLRTADIEEAQNALTRLLNVLRAPYRLGQAQHPGREHTLEITASIGATLYPQDLSEPETLLRHAGHALYRVKHNGRNAYRFFDSAKRLRDEASLIELARVQQALDDGELSLHYQPKIDMQAGHVLGMEALLRWQHPERGLLGPAEFLPLIESTGLAIQVGDWVIDQALKQSSHWLDQGLRLTVSVNVTARQLQMPDFAQRLLELIQRHEQPVARYLCLEVLEAAALADVAATHELIMRCRAFGVRFALDDFGTGYSTLTYLKRLPVDALKIDRSFVQNMLTDAQDMALIEGVMGLARHFGCEVVAEGVESAAHARALLRLGCQQGQGNGIAAALPADEVPGWVNAFARSPWLMQLGQHGGRTLGLA